MLAGCAASAGVVLLSGFWSLDGVVAGVLRNRLPNGASAPAVIQVLLVAGVLAALTLGALALFRMFAVGFLGEPVRRRGFQPEKVREPAVGMRAPLVVLAVICLVVGLVGIPGVRATFGNVVFAGATPQHEPFSVVALLLTAVFATGGAALAGMIWVRRDEAATDLATRVAAATPLAAATAALGTLGTRLGVLLVRPAALPPLIDDAVLEPLADAVGGGLDVAAGGARRLQAGRLSSYALTAVAATALLALGATLAATGHLPGVGGSR
jgi:NADH:ubiquinone oxidoreductase subunit 5 (subunit L)/multisubunit Na+/H+ antiporter MnhA subunit